MSTKLSPIESELETEEQSASYDLWFFSKVEAALSDQRPPVPHDQAMVRMQSVVASAKQEKA